MKFADYAIKNKKIRKFIILSCNLISAVIVAAFYN